MVADSRASYSGVHADTAQSRSSTFVGQEHFFVSSQLSPSKLCGSRFACGRGDVITQKTVRIGRWAPNAIGVLFIVRGPGWSTWFAIGCVQLQVKYSPAGDKLIISIHIRTHYYYCNVLVHPARSKEPKGLVHSAGQSFQYVRSDILVEGLNPKTKYLIRTQRCYTGVYSLQKEICGGHATFL